MTKIENRKIDEKDHEIIEILDKDGRTSLYEIGRRIELSPPPTLRRVRFLEKFGYITGYKAVINYEACGLGREALFTCFLNDDMWKEFENLIKDIPNVLDWWSTDPISVPSAIYVVKVLVKDNEEMELITSLMKDNEKIINSFKRMVIARKKEA